VGEKEQRKLQRKLIRLLPDSVEIFPRVRIRISPSRFRVPDIAGYLTEPVEQVFLTPPFLVIEILSLVSHDSETGGLRRHGLPQHLGL
jgi:Uma2 family endonuclease